MSHFNLSADERPANKGPVLYKRLVLYEGGYPGVPEGSAGELIVQDGAVQYAGRRQRGKIKEEPIIIPGDAVASAQYVPAKRGVEVHGTLNGIAFTATFGLVAMHPEKEGQRLVEAVEALRFGRSGSDSEFQPDHRLPYHVRHASGLPSAESGQTAALKVYDRSVFIWRARKGLISMEYDEKATREWSYEIPLESLRSARIETGDRLVAMRIITTGLFGLLWKKRDKFLVLEWDNPRGLNVPIILSFNAANRALAEIQQAKMTMGASEQMPDSRSPTTSSPSAADRLRQLKQLFDEGVITEAEYLAKKTELLDDV
ncbi:MAG: hypothetical protein A2148_06440 [Chloroflexi bacterium RBG_16_68_14]|nr:MAG: hypothetical protein A2148_06440 [Chloroflexi bacterium RBG_16_68_14]